MSLKIYRSPRYLKDQKNFKSTVKIFKQKFFDSKIQENSSKRKSPWKLINWIKKRKLPVIEAIKYNNKLCLEIEDL